MKKILFYAKIAFIIGLFAWVAVKFDFKTAGNIIATANLGWAGVAVVFQFVSLYFVSLRWKMIIRGFWKRSKTTLFQLFWFYQLGVFYSLFLPTSLAGEAIRVWRLAKNEDKDYAKAAFTAILDRIIGVSTWFILFIILPTHLPKNRLLLLVLLVPLALYIFKDKIAYKEKKLLDFSEHHPLDIFYAVTSSVLCQLAYLAAGYAVFRCFNVHIGVLYGAGVLAAGALVMLIPISMLGFGVREGFFIATLPLYGALPTQAVFVTSFFVFLTYISGITGGFIELMNTGWKLSSLKNPDIKDNSGSQNPLQ